MLELHALLGLHLLDDADHVLHRGDPVFRAMDEKARGRAGSQEGEIIPIGHGGDRDEALDLRTAHEQLHADPRSEGDAGDPAGARVRVHGLSPIESRRRVREFALAVVESALAAADAAEIEAQNRKAAVQEVVVKVIDDLVVHRAPELRVRVQHDGDGSPLMLRGLVATLNTTGWPREDDLRHSEPLDGLTLLREGRMSWRP